ncbi:unnamed protein product [Amoebophrya sp. A120]|nr:unnamed protein product [Amoebophrya sp. A120]|eukprot:GSA120T00003708001.1
MQNGHQVGLHNRGRGSSYRGNGTNKSQKDRLKGCMGLVNLGNTCYMNSALQCLSHSQPFQKWFRKCYQHPTQEEMRKWNNQKKLVHQLYEVFEKNWGETFNGRACEPIDFIHTLGHYNNMYQGSQQHDTQEFLRTLLDCVHEELKTRIPRNALKFCQEEYNHLESPSTYAVAHAAGPPSGSKTPQSYRNAADDGVNRFPFLPPARKSADDYEQNYAQDIVNSPSRKKAVPLHHQQAMASRSSSKIAADTSNENEQENLYCDSSIVSEVFGGSLQSTITCLECGNKSHTIEQIFDISVPIPNEPLPPTQGGGRAGSPADQGGKQASPLTNSFSAARVGSMLQSFGKQVMSAFHDRGIALDDCIRKFCEPEQLTGTEQYDCEKCKKKSNGEKVMYIKELPEILAIHLKRFSYSNGWFGNKNTKPVSFPIQELCMAQHLDPNRKREASSQSGDRKNSKNNNTSGGSSSSTATSAASGGTKYRLIGLIQHSGNMGGGHYIAYCRHAKRPNDWLEFDDARVNISNEEQVKHAEPYVLFYQKISPGDFHEEEKRKLKDSYKQLQDQIMDLLRTSVAGALSATNNPSLQSSSFHQGGASNPAAQHSPLLVGTSAATSSTASPGLQSSKVVSMPQIYERPPPELGKVVFISRRWYVRCRTMSDPGPIDNHQFLSAHGYVGCSRVEVICQKFIPIAEEVYYELQRRYGGGPCLRSVKICEKSMQWIKAYNQRKVQEFQLVSRYDTKDTGDGEFWYLVDANWVHQWKRYVKSDPISDVSEMIAPLKVTNYRLFEPPTQENPVGKPRKNLKVKFDFMGVNARVWALFTHFHGVLNPDPNDQSAVCRVGLDCDSPQGQEESDLRPDEISVPEDEAVQRMSWQFVDVYHGNWAAFKQSKYYRDPPPVPPLNLEGEILDHQPHLMNGASSSGSSAHGAGGAKPSALPIAGEIRSPMRMNGSMSSNGDRTSRADDVEMASASKGPPDDSDASMQQQDVESAAGRPAEPDPGGG